MVAMVVEVEVGGCEDGDEAGRILFNIAIHSMFESDVMLYYNTSDQSINAVVSYVTVCGPYSLLTQLESLQ